MYVCMYAPCVLTWDGRRKWQIINSFLCIHVCQESASPLCSFPVVLLFSPLLSSPLPFHQSFCFLLKNHMISGERCKMRQTLYPLRICSTSREIHSMTISHSLSLPPMHSFCLDGGNYVKRAWRRKSDWAICVCFTGWTFYLACTIKENEKKIPLTSREWT